MNCLVLRVLIIGLSEAFNGKRMRPRIDSREDVNLRLDIDMIENKVIVNHTRNVDDVRSPSLAAAAGAVLFTFGSLLFFNSV